MSNVVATQVTTTPTQTLHPWRATFRTLFAVLVGVATSWGLLVQELNLDPNWRWVAAGALVAATVTRFLANPGVEAFLQAYLPWLSAQPKGKKNRR